jgi:hypothetical protein
MNKFSANSSSIIFCIFFLLKLQQKSSLKSQSLNEIVE